MARATLLLPDAERFGGQRLHDELARTLGRADALALAGPQAQRCFDILPAGWPAAAVSRQMDRGDADGHLWLRADPVHVRPDISGARLLAHGRAMQMTSEDVEAILPALKPLFGDAGFALDAAAPDRWYLQLPKGTTLPGFSSPEAALGAELFEHMPGGDSRSPEARRWRSLLSEVQVVLHNHPRNGDRVAAGRPAINSLWFWGAGRLPSQVRGSARHLLSDDDTLLAFGRLAGLETGPLPATCPESIADTLVDLRDARDLGQLQASWLTPLMAGLRAGVIKELVIDCESGQGFRIRTSQRWRFWRKPQARFAG